jgi:hypothetical protein
MFSRGSCSANVDDVLGVIAKAVSQQNCILFLGAGVHAPPPEGSSFVYPEEYRPPIGSALSRQLAGDCRLAEQLPTEDPSNLQRVSLFYEASRNRPQLEQAVVAAVGTGRRPSSLLRGLAEIGFPVVITTNYDRLLERALYAAGKEPRVAVYSPDPHTVTTDFPRPTANSPVVYKLHGDIEQPKTIVITDEDYITFVMRMNMQEPYDPIPLRLKVYLTDWTTVFVGYSLLDYNLRLLFKTLRWRMDTASTPTMYSVDLRPDPLIVDVWDNQRRYVKFIAQDAWTVVPRLHQLVLGRELQP